MQYKEGYNMANEEVRLRNIQAVLDSAGELFLSEGVQRVTLKMVAEKSHVSIRSLHRYFPEKPKLVLEVYRGESKNYVEDGLKLLKWATHKLHGQKLVEAVLEYQFHYIRKNHRKLHHLVEMRWYLKENGIDFEMTEPVRDGAEQFVDTLKTGIEEWSDELNHSEDERAAVLAEEIEKTVQLLFRGVILAEDPRDEIEVVRKYLVRSKGILANSMVGNNS